MTRRPTGIREIRGTLHHYDPPQLEYQLAEIVGERTYLRHGVDVREGDVVLDVGANVGVAAVFFAASCGAGLVHSFEPVPPLFELLRENVAPYPACVPHPFGFSSTARQAEITYYRAAAAMSGLYADPDADRALVHKCLLNLGLSEEQADRELDGRYETTTMRCELRTLSAVLAAEPLDAVDLLKVDVEKAELDVLRGIEPPDWRRIRQVVAEVHDEAGRLAAILAMLEEHGFRATTAQDAIMRGTSVWLVYARRR